METKAILLTLNVHKLGGYFLLLAPLPLVFFAKGPFKYVTFFLPILDPPLPHVSFGDTGSDPPSPCDVTIFNLQKT